MQADYLASNMLVMRHKGIKQLRMLRQDAMNPLRVDREGGHCNPQLPRAKRVVDFREDRIARCRDHGPVKRLVEHHVLEVIRSILYRPHSFQQSYHLIRERQSLLAYASNRIAFDDPTGFVEVGQFLGCDLPDESAAAREKINEFLRL